MLPLRFHRRSPRIKSLVALKLFFMIMEDFSQKNFKAFEEFLIKKAILDAYHEKLIEKLHSGGASYGRAG